MMNTIVDERLISFKELEKKVCVKCKLEIISSLWTCKNILQFRKEYPCAFIAIGDNKVRKRYSKLLEDYKFLVSKIVSPAANVSSAARIGKGTVVLPQATIRDAEWGEFCILVSNSLANSGSEAKGFTHIDCGGIVLKGQMVSEGTVVRSGEIFG